MTQASNLAKGGSNFNTTGNLSLTTGVTGTLPVANGGTGSTTTTGAANAILPSQTSNTGKYLTTDGTNTSWGTVTSNPGTVTSITAGTGLSGGTITSSGTIAIANTAVTAGSYTNSAITVDAQGRLTAASSGTAPVTSVTGTAPVVSSGGATPAISMPAATTSVSGYLTSTDWNTFNGKQAAGSYVTVGGALGTPSSGTLTNCTFPTLNQNTTGTAANLAGAAFSTGSTGYYTIRSSGLIIQWGQATLAANTNTTTSYAITFPTASLATTSGSPIGATSGTSGWAPSGACPNNTSSARIWNTDDSSNTIWYIAIGY